MTASWDIKKGEGERAFKKSNFFLILARFSSLTLFDASLQRRPTLLRLQLDSTSVSPQTVIGFQ